MRMKKRGMLLLTCVALIGSTSNVYGETFNIQSQGMDIFNTLNEDGLDKQDVEAWLGQSKGTEEMFHAVYDYSLGGVDGELKVRYDDEYLLMMSKITDDIDEYTQVGRCFWRTNEKRLPETYTYQIESLGDLNYDFGLNEALETFQEVPVIIDDRKSDDGDAYTFIKYEKYPMFGELGTLTLAFENNKIRKNNSWTFKLPEGKTFSDYSELICKSWLVTVKDMSDLLEQEYNDYSETEILVSCMRKISDYYQQVFQEENRKEMKTFDSALRNYYLMASGEDNKFSEQIEECLYEMEDDLDEENLKKIPDKILEIWKNSDKCEYRWEQIIEQKANGFLLDQPVGFQKSIYDENMEEDNSKCIEINLNIEDLIDEE